MDPLQLEALLSEVSEIIFEPSFDRQHAPHSAGLVFGRMTRSVRGLIGQLRDFCFRERMLLYFRPMGEDGLALSFIVREAHFIANSTPLRHDHYAFDQFAAALHRDERLILAAYQRDRNGALRLVTDAQYDPYFLPVYYFRTAQALVEH